MIHPHQPGEHCSSIDNPDRYTRPELFSLDEFVASIPVRLLETTQGRRALTRLDPMAFALVYLGRHVRGAQGVTLSEFHVDLVRQAQQWVKPLSTIRAHRDLYVAPRESGKSTWLFLLAPLWAAAHGHLSFILALADSAGQAEGHLMTLRDELDGNRLLNEDYPELCEPAKATKVGRTLATSRGQIRQANGFVFQAKGVDSALAGIKVGATRPQLMILDDIEPAEGKYSDYQAGIRLRTIRDMVFPLNSFARVVIAGTTTMPGSIIHQAVKQVTAPAECPDWVATENIKAHYYPALITQDDGSERSLWPQKWPLAVLQGMRHERSFRLNFQNDPMATEGTYWSEDVFIHRRLDTCTRTVLSIDPAVTSGPKSDETGMAIVGYSPSEAMCMVEWCEGVKLAPGEPLRAKVLQVLAQFPHITAIHVETNQGGALWQQVFHDMPKHIRVTFAAAQTVAVGSKAARAAQALTRYQRGKIVHAHRLHRLEEQLVAFTGKDGQKDDLVDAVTTAINGFLGTDTRPGLRIANADSRYASH